MRTLLQIFALASIAVTLRAGTILGSVHAEANPELSDSGKSGKYDSRKFKFVEKIDYSELKDFIVFIDQPVTNAPSFSTNTVQIITQRDAVFRPGVLPVMVGTTVEWPNKDDIFHNVFSMSESNPFDLGLYKDPEVKKVQFQNPGRVDVFCSIHSQMNCVLLVLQNPFFASTGKSRRYRIENVPPGTYKLKAWHHRLPAQMKEIVVPASGEVRVDFTLGVKGLPKY
ncbi:MAG TPA: carboxypeptidase regulatory-like domain-containing protein [Verrucomicrobiae bacterium]